MELTRRIDHLYKRYRTIRRFSQTFIQAIQLLWFFRLASSTYLKGAIHKDEYRFKKFVLNIFNRATIVYFRPTQGDLLIFNEVFVQGQYELLNHIKAINTVIDLGANVGFTSLFLIRKYNPSKIILVEPSEKNLTVAEMNLHYWIGTNQCHFYPAAVHYKSGTVYLDESLAPYNLKTHISTGNRAIDTITVPDIMREQEIELVDLLKIDIEGAERYLFQENTEWLKSIKNIIIELHLPLDQNWLEGVLAPYGFEILSDHNNFNIFLAVNKNISA